MTIYRDTYGESLVVRIERLTRSANDKHERIGATKAESPIPIRCRVEKWRLQGHDRPKQPGLVFLRQMQTLGTACEFGICAYLRQMRVA
jgi:hypothetical protein